MAVKKSVRLVDVTIEQCRIVSRVSRNSAEDSINWSGSINAIADEYATIMQENKPELSESEWNVLHCIYNGYKASEDAQREARLLSWHISEGYQHDSQVAQFLESEEKAIEFIERIKKWSLTMQLSAIYHAKKFWAGE